MAVADPGFPVGGANMVESATFWKNCNVKMEESGSLGGAHLDPPMDGKHERKFDVVKAVANAFAQCE